MKEKQIPKKVELSTIFYSGARVYIAAYVEKSWLLSISGAILAFDVRFYLKVDARFQLASCF